MGLRFGDACGGRHVGEDRSGTDQTRRHAAWTALAHLWVDSWSWVYQSIWIDIEEQHYAHESFGTNMVSSFADTTQVAAALSRTDLSDSSWQRVDAQRLGRHQ